MSFIVQETNKLWQIRKSQDSTTRMEITSLFLMFMKVGKDMIISRHGASITMCKTDHSRELSTPRSNSVRFLRDSTCPLRVALVCPNNKASTQFVKRSLLASSTMLVAKILKRASVQSLTINRFTSTPLQPCSTEIQSGSYTMSLS